MGINEIIKIGTRLKEIRQAAKISQKDMAEKIGIPYSTYSNYENNNREPSLDVLKRFCQTMNIRIIDLLEFNEIADKKECDKEETFLSFCNYLNYTVIPETYKGYSGFQIIKDNSSYFIDTDTFLRLLEKVSAFTKFDIEEILKTADEFEENL